MLLHELSAPGVDLLVDVDLHWADVAAAAVERRSKGQIAVFARVERRIDDEANGAGISGSVAEAAAAPVNRTGVHAGPTADTFERCPELRHPQALGPAVIHQHDVHLAAVAGPAEMRGVLRDGRTQRAAREEAYEHCEMLEARDDLLDSDRGNVQLGHVR